MVEDNENKDNEKDLDKRIYEMMGKYFAHVQDRHQLLTEKKTALAKPLLKICQRYMDNHMELHRVWSESRGELTQTFPTRGSTSHIDPTNFCWKSRANKAWEASVPGKLQRAVKNLIKTYVVFSFYGSGYDHAFIQAYLIPLFFELKLQPKMEKSGNKVVSISTRTGISFRDVTKLLSPGTSLRQFAKMTNLFLEKSHFPFAILTGPEALKIPRLPSQAKDWKSDLTGPSITQEEVDQSLELFEKRECQNVGDFLRVYLILDVEILLRAVETWRFFLKEQVDVDFLESRKFTISSLSHLAGQRYLARIRAVGNFFPNNSQVYRLLKKGMRGGLCTVMRSEAGAQDIYRREAKKSSLHPDKKRSQRLRKRAGFHYRNNAHLYNQSVCTTSTGPRCDADGSVSLIQDQGNDDDDDDDNDDDDNENRLEGNPLEGDTGTIVERGKIRADRHIAEMGSGIRNYRSQRLRDLNDGREIIPPVDTTKLCNHDGQGLRKGGEEAEKALSRFHSSPESDYDSWEKKIMGRGASDPPPSPSTTSLDSLPSVLESDEVEDVKRKMEKALSKRIPDRELRGGRLHLDNGLASALPDPQADSVMKKWASAESTGRPILLRGDSSSSSESDENLQGPFVSSFNSETNNSRRTKGRSIYDRDRRLTSYHHKYHVVNDGPKAEGFNAQTDCSAASDASSLMVTSSSEPNYNDDDDDDRRKSRKKFKSKMKRPSPGDGVDSDSDDVSTIGFSTSPTDSDNVKKGSDSNVHRKSKRPFRFLHKKPRFAPTRTLRRRIRRQRWKQGDRSYFLDWWRPNYRQPGQSNHLAYYDAASLYPSSGEFFLSAKVFFSFPNAAVSRPSHPSLPDKERKREGKC